MRLHIQPGHHPPIYQQITEQLRRRIASGALEAGHRLPSVRALAEQLVVNPNTVARAYRELEREHYLVSRPGDGVFVADRTSPFFEKDRRELLVAAVDRLLLEAEQLGVESSEVVALIEKRETDRSSRAS